MSNRTIYFRGPHARIEHVTRDASVTLCGKSARIGARYSDSDRGADSVLRPLCAACRAVMTR